MIVGRVLVLVLCLSCAAASTRAQDSRPAGPDPEIAAALKRISRERIEATIRRLAAFGTRHALAPAADADRGGPAAARFILGEFEKAGTAAGGRMTAALSPFDPREQKGVARFLPEWWKEKTLTNVVAKLQGSEPDRILIVGGHFDSRATERFDVKADAPGANDDGSGTAVVIELARALAEARTRASVWFVAFTAEEEGLWGSEALAAELDRGHANVEAILNNDIVGGGRHDEPGAPRNVIRLFSEGRPVFDPEAHPTVQAWARGESESDSPSRQWARFVRAKAAIHVPTADVRLVFRQDRYLRGGDHKSFNVHGFAGARMTEDAENYDRQHQNIRTEGGKRFGDLPEFVDYEYVRLVAEVNAAAILEAARAPRSPSNVFIDTRNLMNETRLLWAKSVDPAIAGYRIHMRRTHEPDWTVTRDVGLQNEATVPESKDDWLFAVSAVDRDGRSSVPAFAGARRR